MLRAYKDKTTGLWKWGTRGEPKYDTQGQAEKAGMDILTKRLREVRDKLNGVLLNHGK